MGGRLNTCLSNIQGERMRSWFIEISWVDLQPPLSVFGWGMEGGDGGLKVMRGNLLARGVEWCMGWGTHKRVNSGQNRPQ